MHAGLRRDDGAALEAIPIRTRTKSGTISPAISSRCAAYPEIIAAVKLAAGKSGRLVPPIEVHDTTCCIFQELQIESGTRIIDFLVHLARSSC